MKIYDLSCELKDGMWYYGKPYIPFAMEEIATMEENGYIARSLSMSTHMGTHVECANHWGYDKKTLDQIDIESFIGSAKVLRFPYGNQELFEIDKQKIVGAGGENLNEGDICILNTGWDAYIDDELYVTNSPFISIDAAEYLVEKKIKLLAVDFPMCGDPRDGLDFVSEGTLVPDTILYDSDIPCIVGLVNVGQLPDEVFFHGCPLNIKGSDGSPLRAYAIEF